MNGSFLRPLKLDNAGVTSENRDIKADNRCRTSVRHILAVGDVIGGLMLAHAADSDYKNATD